MHIGELKTNIVADTDAYKYGHHKFINRGLTEQYTYLEARAGAKYPETVFFGLSAIIQKHLLSPVTLADIQEAIKISVKAFGYNTVDVETWTKVAELGYLPIEIKAVPEGTVVPVNNVLMTVRSTETWFAKACNLLETTLMRVWYPSSIATRSYNIKKGLTPLFKKTGTLAGLDFSVVDFGLRGATSMDAGELGGMAHLICFCGSDNMRAGRGLAAYYGGDFKIRTIVASEHSVALSYGRAHEKEYLKMMLTAFGDVPVSIVIDTYDAHGFIRNHVSDPEILAIIRARKSRVVFRPDSGIPELIVAQILSLLADIFGYSFNELGYKVLNDNIGIIQGDGMDEVSIIKLYETIIQMGWSADNLAVGSGGGLLQKDITRDTQRFAIKPSFGIIDGAPFNFKKNPTTDPTKASKSGELKLHPTYNGGFITISSAETSDGSFKGYVDSLRTVLLNGVFTETTLSEVESNISRYL